LAPQTEPLSVNVILCQQVLTEKTELVSAIRVLDTLTIAPGYNLAHFFVVTTVSSKPGDIWPHSLQVAMATVDGRVVASAPEYKFFYGYKVDLTGYGGFRLTTQFDVALESLGTLGQFLILVYLDGVPVAKTPITLRRS
jgi:hypothetical protein